MFTAVLHVLFRYWSFRQYDRHHWESSLPLDVVSIVPVAAFVSESIVVFVSASVEWFSIRPGHESLECDNRDIPHLFSVVTNSIYIPCEIDGRKWMIGTQ